MKNSVESYRAGLITAALLISSFSLASADNNAGATSGVYDENAFAINTVDASATALTAATFATNVATAFGNNQGGVINFDNTNVNVGIGTITSTFGTAQGKMLALGYGDNNTNNYNFQSANGNVAAISGTAANTIGNYFITLGNSGTTNNYTFTFGAITGGAIGEGVTQTGFTLLGRNSNPAGTATVTALFSNSTNAVATRAYSGTGRGTEDTFFGFTAPSGAFIQSVNISFDTVGSVRPLDDFGFITAVPEPSTYVLVLCSFGLLVSLHRLRRPRGIA